MAARSGSGRSSGSSPNPGTGFTTSRGPSWTLGRSFPGSTCPLELGLFLGAKFYGASRQQAKAAIIFDRDRYRYQVFCSDIAGQDIRAHNGREAELIRAVRDALATWRPEQFMPGGRAIYTQYRRFARALPRMAAKTRLRVQEFAFSDLTRIVDEWLIAEPG